MATNEETTKTPVQTLIETVARITQITKQYGDIEHAKGLPRQYGMVSMRITRDSHGYNSRPMTPGEIATEKEILAEYSTRRRRIGEIERDALLTSLCTELHTLRSDLCNQAAAAAIEIGTIIRDNQP